MIRTPIEVIERLDRLAEQLYREYERGEIDIEITAQGPKGTWIPYHAIITKALDEFEASRKVRKAKTPRKKKGSKK